MYYELGPIPKYTVLHVGTYQCEKNNLKKNSILEEKEYNCSDIVAIPLFTSCLDWQIKQSCVNVKWHLISATFLLQWNLSHVPPAASVGKKQARWQGDRNTSSSFSSALWLLFFFYLLFSLVVLMPLFIYFFRWLRYIQFLTSSENEPISQICLYNGKNSEKSVRHRNYFL